MAGTESSTGGPYPPRALPRALPSELPTLPGTHPRRYPWGPGRHSLPGPLPAGPAGPNLAVAPTVDHCEAGPAARGSRGAPNGFRYPALSAPPEDVKNVNTSKGVKAYAWCNAFACKPLIGAQSASKAPMNRFLTTFLQKASRHRNRTIRLG